MYSNQYINIVLVKYSLRSARNDNLGEPFAKKHLLENMLMFWGEIPSWSFQRVKGLIP